ncbi:BON domain-containing protein [Microbacterium sp.]|uniref:BON domain-containing protein n=1 Tax=Microbacterium sp. TaxID=51671 RepID=UPI001ACBE7C5|nr:BON domain-containing protein [Microbacterium sp.]MBN9158107.1 BON domain-containing protein [Microbacterium sp.]
MDATRRADLDIKEDIADELEWAHDVDPVDVGVFVRDGAVTLSGEVGSEAEKVAAREAVRRVRGVRALVDDLRIRPEPSDPGRAM